MQAKPPQPGGHFSRLKGEAGQIGAYHGSPYRFKQFDISKIGTGEGAEAFGHGLYFTNKKEIAKHYAKKSTTKTGKGYTYTVTVHKGKKPGEYDYLKWDEPIGESHLNKIRKTASADKYYDAGVDDNIAELIERAELVAEDVGGSNLYQEVSRSLGSDKAASEFLLESGIDGIDYPAGSLSGVQGGGRNFVVFDPSAVTIEGVKSESGAIGGGVVTLSRLGRLIPAIKSPNTGKVYTGWAHKSILNEQIIRQEPKAGKAVWQGIFDDNAGKGSSIVGFVDKNGEFISRMDAEKAIEQMSPTAAFHEGSSPLGMLGVTGLGAGGALTLGGLLESMRQKKPEPPVAAQTQPATAGTEGFADLIGALSDKELRQVADIFERAR